MACQPRRPLAHFLGRMGRSTETTAAQAELTSLVERDYRRLVGVVAVVFGSTAVAEDAVQEALVRAWERVGRGATFDHLAGWVVVVAINQVRQVERRSRAEQHAVARLAARDAATGAHDEVVDLQRAVAALPGRQREVVVLHYLLGLDVKATARVLNISEGTVKTGLFRARAALAARLADLDAQEDTR